MKLGIGMALAAVAAGVMAIPTHILQLKDEAAPLYAASEASENYMVVMDRDTPSELMDANYRAVNEFIVSLAEARTEQRNSLQDMPLLDLFKEIVNGRVLDVLNADEADYGFGHVYNIGGDESGFGPGNGASLFKGFSGRFDRQTVELIRRLPGVKYVEMDHTAHASEIERGAPWGLARISHKKPLSFSTFNRYDYDKHGGQDVAAYVIDTGVSVDHVEFEGRATWGKTIPRADTDTDAHGHGTHVAGTIASKTYGVAKLAHIVAVKVLGSNGSGSMSDVVAGVVWAAEDAVKKIASGKYKGTVANMSLGGGYSRALNEAVDAAIESGLFFAVAAGNDNQNACSYSPASSEHAFTVAASTISDDRAYFSNYGDCVQVFAPGLNILSTWNSGNEAVATLSGTSMASPHVAGIAAYFLGLAASESESKAKKTTAVSPIVSFVSGCHGAIQAFLRPARVSASAYAPTPKPVLSPAELEKLILKYSSPDLIANPGLGTPDLLINNHYV